MKKVIVLCAVILSILLISLPVLAGCGMFLSVEIKNPDNGDKVDRNLKNVIGQVSDPGATVTVNGKEAEVNERGRFSAIVELTEGENVIEAVATLDWRKVSTSVTIIYNLDLALELNLPQLRLGEDYTESPIEAHGHVSDSRAKVTVNGKPVEIGKVYGRFSTMVDLAEGENTIEAVATLGEHEVRETQTTYFRPKAPLSLEVKSPEDGAELNIDFIKVSGTVSDSEDRVVVNNVEAQVADDGSFYAYITLKEGKNRIDAFAQRGVENVSDTINVSYSPPPEDVVRDTLSIGIDFPEDKDELKVNMLPVSGAVSDPEATVVVNGIEAKVAGDGIYYAYIELAEGENDIEAVAIRDMAKSSETITVSFIPALVVRLDYPYPGEIGVDYTKTPLTVTGSVNNPEAAVTVNDIEANVAADGSFSTQIPLKIDSNTIKAVTRLGTDEDEIVYLIILTPEGRLVPPPGGSGGPRYFSRVDLDHEVMLKAGETKVLDAVLQTGKEEPFPFTCVIGRVGGEYGEELLPMPEGMKVSIEPSEFTAYPRTAYHFSIIIETTHQLAPGLYSLRYECYFQEGIGARQGGYIIVTVE